MRKYAILKEPKDNIKRIMLHETDEGLYLYEYNTVKDEPCCSDLYFDSREAAETFIKAEFEVMESDWILIGDALEFCQNDLILPIRIKGRDIGKPVWGHYERLQDGVWIDHRFE